MATPSGAACEDVVVAVQGFSDLQERNEHLQKVMAQITKAATKQGYCFDAKYRLGKLSFCLVLLGTELDMIGFMMNVANIDRMDNAILSGMTGCLMASFFFVLMAVTDWPALFKGCDEYFESEDQKDKSNFAGVHQPRANISFTEGSFLSKLNSVMRAVWPHAGKLLVYHWCPLMRPWILVKETITPADVDAIFKVNGLSSFTLGFVTFFATVCIYAERGTLWGWEFELYISIGSWLLNWSITLAYYALPIAKWMSTATTAVNICNHFQGLMDAWAKLCSKEATMTQMELEQCNADGKTIREVKAEMKARLITLMVAKFVGDTCDPAIRKQMEDALSFTRDVDVKGYFVLVRDQVLSSIALPGNLS